MALLTGTVKLSNITFHAYHGVYRFERTKGNVFEVDVEVEKNYEEAELQKLKDTVDYEIVFAIVEKEMKHKQHLLETVVLNIITEIEKKFTGLKKISVEVRKTNPPIKNANVKSSGFRLVKEV